ncbi:hypothetical protein MMC34_002012 [Xylographa carneopallida]|nr:hypothetical protein [Xylographa carneopallida]
MPSPSPSTSTPAPTPRVFLLRHGETVWTLSGRFTGTTDLPLTAHGAAQVRSTARLLVGPRKLLAPARLAAVWVSPRARAQRTAELFFGGEGRVPFDTTPLLAEWDYGAYEGLLAGEIRARWHAAAGAGGRAVEREREWDIWRDGCEGGESPAAITARLDELIARIRALHGPALRAGQAADVVLVAHGHILRAFAKRWLGYALEVPLAMMLEPGGVGVLSYQHGRMEEPAFLLGLGFPVEEEEGEEGERGKDHGEVS